MSLLSKIFCSHVWKTHAKKKYQLENWLMNSHLKYEPTGITEQYTTEVVICEKCGKIKR